MLLALISFVILNLILRMPITKKIAGIDVTQFGEVVAAV
jgi:hypothetical protein